jgi:hypothetical protein
MIKLFGPVAPPKAAQSGGAIPCWLISGEVETTGDTLNVDPILPVVRSELPPMPDAGPYTFVLLDSTGKSLLSIPFAPALPVIEENESPTLAYGNFVFEVPQMSGMAAFQVVHQNTVLTNHLVATINPSVQFIAPSAGAVLTNDIVYIAWNGTDSAGLPLSYWLEYSGDGGTNWETLAVDLATSQFTGPLGLLRGSTNAYFQVTASDGFNSASALTGPLVVPDHPPQVDIAAPIQGDVFTGDEPVILRATAWDMEDGQLSASQFHWADSINGDLGVGDEISLDASTLAEGDHLLTVTATDSAGNKSAANVRVAVQRVLSVPLQASIVGDQIELTWPSWASTFTVLAAFNIDSSYWFPIEGAPVESGENLVLDVPLLEDTLFFKLSE